VPDIGSRLELFADHYLIDRMRRTSLVLQHPIPREAVLRLNEPWEGPFCGYFTIIKDGDVFRGYYRGMPEVTREGGFAVTCYAESSDGIAWTKPSLGLFEVCGTRDNNVILADDGSATHNFCPFLDAKPGVPDSERFKAVGGSGSGGLTAFVSADGIRWRKLRDEPIITEGAFDSQNLAFWSESEGCYICYFRVFAERVRTVSRTTSDDFLSWTPPERMSFGDTPMEHLYTNQTQPYFRAPHIYIATPARFFGGRRVITDGQAEAIGVRPKYAGDCSDNCLMSSRGGTRYDRTFMEGFIRPGMGYENWVSRTNYPGLGIVPTGPGEMSLYVHRNYAQPTGYLQRCTLRTDGFVSVSAPYEGGEMLTKPLTFVGGRLAINYATSAAGSVRVEIRDADGKPVPGYGLRQATPVIGDEISRVVTWRDGQDVSSLAGKAVRLRFVMKDADLFSMRFE